MQFSPTRMFLVCEPRGLAPNLLPSPPPRCTWALPPRRIIRSLPLAAISASWEGSGKEELASGSLFVS